MMGFPTSNCYKMADKDGPSGRKSRKREGSTFVTDDNRDRPDGIHHKAVQTDETPCRHIGIQLEHPPHDKRHVERVTVEETDLASSLDTTNNVTSGSVLNLVNNPGPVQLGQSSAINHNHNTYNTYNTSNNNTYNVYNSCNHCQPAEHSRTIQLVKQQTMALGDGSEALASQPDEDKHQTYGIRNTTALHAVAQTRDDNQNPSMIPELVPKRIRLSDNAIDHMTCELRTEVRRKDGYISKPDETVSSPVMSASSGEIQDTVSVLDCEGRELEVGDCLYVWSTYPTWAVYAGSGDIIRYDLDTGRVVKDGLMMKESFGRLRVYSGECHVFSPRKRIDKASSWIGKRFTEGDGLDFLTTIYTGLRCEQAVKRGFNLWL